MTDLDLDAIEARANAASDGPWIVVHEPAWEADDVQHPDVIKVGAPLYVGDDEPFTVCLVSIDHEDDPVDVLGDAEFIAHARTDVPALVAEVRRLTSLVHARESWIDGAKVDMAAMEESLCGFSEEWHSRIIAERNEARAEAQKATAWHMEALDDLAACVAERDDARAEAERLMQEVERLHNAVRDIDAAYLVARAQDRADGGYRDGYCDGLEHAERIMRGN